MRLLALEFLLGSPLYVEVSFSFIFKRVTMGLLSCLFLGKEVFFDSAYILSHKANQNLTSPHRLSMNFLGTSALPFSTGASHI